MSPEVLTFMKDATRNISRFGSIIERSPLQTYASLLLFSPLSSKVRQRFWNTRLPASSHVQDVELDWDTHLQTLEAHECLASYMSFSPDGKFLASAFYNSTIRVWNTATGTHLATLKDNMLGYVTYMIFSPNGSRLATKSDDGMAHMWNITTWTHMHTIKSGDGDIKTFSFTPDSRFLVSVTDANIIQCWSVDTGTHQQTILSSPTVFLTCLSSDGQLVASASSGGGIRLWNLTTGATQHMLTTHIEDI
jgi:WD40 repeat protein